MSRMGWLVRTHRASGLILTAAVVGYAVTGELLTWGAEASWVTLHTAVGLDGGWLSDLWAVFADVVSLGLLFFVGSGVVLWWRRTPDRRMGVALLAAGTLLTVGTVVRLWLFV